MASAHNVRTNLHHSCIHYTCASIDFVFQPEEMVREINLNIEICNSLLLCVKFFAVIEVGLSILFNFLVDIFSDQPNRAGNPPFNRKRTKE